MSCGDMTARTAAVKDSIPGAARWVRGRTRRWLAIARLATAAGWPVISLSVAANITIGLLPVGFIVGTSVMLERVTSLVKPDHSAGDWGATLVAFGVAIGSLVFQNALTPAQAALGELVTRRVDGHCARRLMAVGLSDAPMALLEERDVLDGLSDARSGLAERSATPGSAAAGLLALIARYTQLAAAVVLVGLVLGPVAGVIMGGTAFVARFGNRGSLARWSAIIRRLAAQRRKLRYVMDSGSHPAIAKEMRLLGLLPWYTARSRSEAESLYTPLWRERRRIYFAPFLLLTAVTLAGATAVLIMLRDAAVGGSLSVLELSLAIQAILVTMRFGVFFPESDVQTQYGMAAYDTLTEFDQRCAVQAHQELPGTVLADEMPRVCICFEDVRFAYPGNERLILSGLDLRIEAGRSTAIVGLNGAGKTTLVKLLAGLYRPTSGRIVVDGVDLSMIDMRSWQKRMAAIFQDYVRYELDAVANIGLGAPARAGDMTALCAAADSAGAAEFLSALPSGLATPLSSRYAGGVDLSGGQWQRIALARALFAVEAGASVLVLDEPTAQLDVRAEVAFFDRFLDLTEGLTTIIISHRFSTVRRADNIVVLERGRITERGSHDDLIRLNGGYAELFRLQASRFSAGSSAHQAPEDIR